jgi:hypothetical protein
MVAMEPGCGQPEAGELRESCGRVAGELRESCGRVAGGWDCHAGMSRRWAVAGADDTLFFVDNPNTLKVGLINLVYDYIPASKSVTLK